MLNQMPVMLSIELFVSQIFVGISLEHPQYSFLTLVKVQGQVSFLTLPNFIYNFLVKAVSTLDLLHITTKWACLLL